MLSDLSTLVMKISERNINVGLVARIQFSVFSEVSRLSLNLRAVLCCLVGV